MAIDTILAGTYRMVHRDSNDNTIAELLEKHSSEFGGTAAAGVPQDDPQKMPKVKKALSTILKEDDKLVVMFKPSATQTEHGTAVGLESYRIPVTFRNRRSGVRYEKTLIYGDFTELEAVGVNSAIWTVNRWYDMATYTIPAQSELKLGHAIQDVRVDSALNLFTAFTKA